MFLKISLTEFLKVRNIGSGVEIRVLGISYRPEFDFVDIQLEAATQAFQLYEIFIEFVTPIYDSEVRLNGMYQDFYVDSVTNETRLLIFYSKFYNVKLGSA